MTNLLPKMFLICSTTYLISSCTDVSLSVMLFCCYFIKIMQYYLKIVQTLLLHISLIVKMVGWEGGDSPKIILIRQREFSIFRNLPVLIIIITIFVNFILLDTFKCMYTVFGLCQSENSVYLCAISIAQSK